MVSEEVFFDDIASPLYTAHSYHNIILNREPHAGSVLLARVQNKKFKWLAIFLILHELDWPCAQSEYAPC